jgi:hypothetical protein
MADTFIPEQIDFVTRPQRTVGDTVGSTPVPTDWAFAYRPAVSGTLYRHTGATLTKRMALTDEEDALLRQLLDSVAKRIVAER